MSDGTTAAESGEARAEEPGTGEETIADMVLAAAREHRGSALRYPEGETWTDMTWEELGEAVRGVARGLIALGIEPGDRVAIFSATRVEWTVCDLGAVCAGAVVAAVYETNSKEEARHVLADCGARLVFCEGRTQLAKVAALRDELPDLEHVIRFEGAAEEDDETMALGDLVEGGQEVDEGAVDERVEGLSADDLFSIVYTSSTTGPAKGCMLTHASYLANCEMIVHAWDPGDDAVFQIGLPLAHTFSRMMQMVAIRTGAELAFWSGDPERLIADLKEIRPTHYPAVPRVWEKLHAAARPTVQEGTKAELLEKLIDTGRKYEDKRYAGERPGPVLAAGRKLADNELLADVRAMFGDRLRHGITGAAPATRETIEFFYACGVPLLEAYGLTETSTGVASNTPEEFRFGTVGRPFEGCEVRIDDDSGEILVRGPNVFRGYWNDEEATREVLDDDGWLRTGDAGSIDDDGFLTVEGRLKDVLVTSSGENIPAGLIEQRIAQSRWIANAVVYGDDREYLVAAVTIDEDERDALAEETGTRDNDHELMRREMAVDDGVRKEIQSAIDDANGDFAPIRQVKRFAILEHDLSVDEGELTPTMKVKREAVYERHRDVFDRLYEEDDDGE